MSEVNYKCIDSKSIIVCNFNKIIFNIQQTTKLI